MAVHAAPSSMALPRRWKVEPLLKFADDEEPSQLQPQSHTNNMLESNSLILAVPEYDAEDDVAPKGNNSPP